MRTRGIEILDSRRVLRNERHIEWRVSMRTKWKFRDLLLELVDLEGSTDSAAESRMEALREDIRSLPGYPRRYDPDRDVIVPVTTSETR